jgi:signal peptidase I
METEPPSHPLHRWTFGRNPRVTLIRLLVLVSVTFVLFKFIFVPIRVTGNSMLPTYRNGQINLINRQAYRYHPPARGDVVAVRDKGSSVILLKRIIALPGETVAVHEGVVYIDGQALEEPYLKTVVRWAEGARRLKSDQYYVVGDNRGLSYHAAVNREHIIGKVVF